MRAGALAAGAARHAPVIDAARGRGLGRRARQPERRLHLDRDAGRRRLQGTEGGQQEQDDDDHEAHRPSMQRAPPLD